MSTENDLQRLQSVSNGPHGQRRTAKAKSRASRPRGEQRLSTAAWEQVRAAIRDLAAPHTEPVPAPTPA